MNRKQRRAREAQIRKDSNDELSAKVAMFGKLPEQCTACEAVFDSKDKEMVTTWNVVVREKEKVVRLYCPDCWGKANKMIEEIQNDLRVQTEGRSETAEQSEPK